MEKNDDDYTITVGNVVRDASGPREDNTWNSKFRYAVKRHGTLNNIEDGDSGYSVGLTFPWKEPGVQPRDGMKATIDFLVGDPDDDQQDYYYDWTELRSPQAPINWGEIELVGRA